MWRGRSPQCDQNSLRKLQREGRYLRDYPTVIATFANPHALGFLQYPGVRNLDSLRIFTSAPEPYLDDYELPILVGATPAGWSQVNGMEWDLPSKADYEACTPRNGSKIERKPN